MVTGLSLDFRADFDEGLSVSLGYFNGCRPIESVIGIVTDDLIERLLTGISEGFLSSRSLIDGVRHWGSTWPTLDGLLHAYGVHEPATHVRLPDGSMVRISLPQCPDLFHYPSHAFAHSQAGDFLHITHSHEQTRGWNDWHTYAFVPDRGEFVVSRVQPKWEHGVIFGYWYQHEDGSEIMEEHQSVNTTTSHTQTDLYFNAGTNLLELNRTLIAKYLGDSGSSLSAEGLKKFLHA